MVDSVRERIVSALLTRTAAARAYTRPDALPARGLFVGPDTDGQIPVYGGQQLTLTATLEQVEPVPTPGADIAAFAAAVDARATAALAELIAALGSGEVNLWLRPGQSQNPAGVARIESASAAGERLFDGRATLIELDGNASGELWQLPAGPLALALGACGVACALLTTVSTGPGFGLSLIAYNTSWFLSYALLLGLAYSCDDSGRLAVMTTGTWLLFQSIGSLAAGFIAQRFGGYAPIGPLGAMACLAGVAVAVPLARRLDRAAV